MGRHRSSVAIRIVTAAIIPPIPIARRGSILRRLMMKITLGMSVDHRSRRPLQRSPFISVVPLSVTASGVICRGRSGGGGGFFQISRFELLISRPVSFVTYWLLLALLLLRLIRQLFGLGWTLAVILILLGRSFHRRSIRSLMLRLPSSRITGARLWTFIHDAFRPIFVLVSFIQLVQQQL